MPFVQQTLYSFVCSFHIGWLILFGGKNYTNFELIINCVWPGYTHILVDALFKTYFFINLKLKLITASQKFCVNSLSTLRADIKRDSFTWCN